jgi:hypothetical protein
LRPGIRATDPRMKNTTLPFVIPRGGSEAKGSHKGVAAARRHYALSTKDLVPLVPKCGVLSLNETGIDRTIGLERQAHSLLRIVALVKDAAKHDYLQRQAQEQ